MTVRAFVSVEYALNRAGFDELNFRSLVTFYGSDVPDAVAGPHVVDTPALAADRSAVQIMNDIGDVLMCGLQKI